MGRRALGTLAVLLLAGTAGVPTRAAETRQITLPKETATFRSSDLPGYELVARNCLTCHSAQYVSMQPPTSTRAYWDVTVRKMKKPFAAPFPEGDIPAMVDYLVRTYGAERTPPQAD